MGKRQTGLLAIGCTFGLAACGNDPGGVTIDPPGDVEITLSGITETPDDFDPAKLYNILHAQSDRLTVLHWDGTSRTYQPPEPPMSEEQIAATISGPIVMAHGGCDVAGDDYPGRWTCVLMVNG